MSRRNLTEIGGYGPAFSIVCTSCCCGPAVQHGNQQADEAKIAEYEEYTARDGGMYY